VTTRRVRRSFAPRQLFSVKNRAQSDCRNLPRMVPKEKAGLRAGVRASADVGSQMAVEGGAGGKTRKRSASLSLKEAEGSKAWVVLKGGFFSSPV
jgi:hypothetical protein